MPSNSPQNDSHRVYSMQSAWFQRPPSKQRKHPPPQSPEYSGYELTKGMVYWYMSVHGEGHRVLMNVLTTYMGISLSITRAPPPLWKQHQPTRRTATTDSQPLLSYLLHVLPSSSLVVQLSPTAIEKWLRGCGDECRRGLLMGTAVATSDDHQLERFRGIMQTCCRRCTPGEAPATPRSIIPMWLASPAVLSFSSVFPFSTASC